MEEERLKEIFSEYDPELSSSLAFMERLDRNLNAVELIHQENDAVMKRNRLAVVIASVAGFVTGVLFTMMFPYINGLLQSLLSNILSASLLPDTHYGIHVVSWFLIGGISVLVSLNTYHISTTLLSHNHEVFGLLTSKSTQSTTHKESV